MRYVRDQLTGAWHVAVGDTGSAVRCNLDIPGAPEETTEEPEHVCSRCGRAGVLRPFDEMTIPYGVDFSGLEEELPVISGSSLSWPEVPVTAETLARRSD